MGVAMPQPAADQPKRVGRYELLAPLAVGGMAEIYCARVEGLEGFEKLVVLKRILPELCADDQFIDMFLDEARLAAMLNHPNIAEVYDIGRADDRYFFTMEYVHGENLNRVMRECIARQGVVPLAEAITIVLGACAGLHHAHEKRDYQGRALDIVHRDVTPSNVLVRFDGCVKLVDFGIAKATSQHTHTRVGTVKGKLPYMSPEQVRGRPIDRRSDIFSLGIVLWEMTTGRKLFRSDDPSIIDQIASRDAPRPSRIRPDYPRDLEEIVMCALSRDRHLRPPTAQALQLALEAFAREHKLEISQVRLASLMTRMFPERAARPPSIMRPASEERTRVDTPPEVPNRPDLSPEGGIVIDVVPPPDSQKTEPRNRTRPYLVVPRRLRVAAIAAVVTLALVAFGLVLLW